MAQPISVLTAVDHRAVGQGLRLLEVAGGIEVAGRRTTAIPS